MPKRLIYGKPDFTSAFERLISTRTEVATDISERAASIIQRVRTGGDAELFSLTKELDAFEIDEQSLVVSSDEVNAAMDLVSTECQNAIKIAAQRITDYHQRQIPLDDEVEAADGSVLGWRWRPVDSAGIYVPGGSASYPSSVLMNAIPAKVAGVKQVMMAVPAPNGRLNPLVLLAAQQAGVDTIFRIGGAQAIAALAYGTESIPAVDKITGPGNAYVAAAKKLVYGDVGIDLVAGPSEVVVIADSSADPAWVAADLLAQAEHDEAAQSILVTTSLDLATAVEQQVEQLAGDLPRKDIAMASWRQHGAMIVVEHLDQAVEVANKIAPEHLQICVEHPQFVENGIRHAGAIFSGEWTPEAVGDYVAGPNHVLPTSGTARFASGLSVLDFMKRTSISRMTSASFSKIGPAAETIAVAEGLDAHALSLRIRLDSLNETEHG